MGTRNRRLPLWHYTAIEPQLRLILQDHAIKPTDVGIEHGERPAVWFSVAQTFEPTAAKTWVSDDGSVHGMTMEEMHQRCGIARIGIDSSTAPVNWETFKRTSGISKTAAKALAQVGNPNLWFASFEPVPAEKWLAIEQWDGTRWVELLAEGLGWAALMRTAETELTGA